MTRLYPGERGRLGGLTPHHQKICPIRKSVTKMNLNKFLYVFKVFFSPPFPQKESLIRSGLMMNTKKRRKTKLCHLFDVQFLLCGYLFKFWILTLCCLFIIVYFAFFSFFLLSSIYIFSYMTHWQRLLSK